jgi:hypothetical protein
VTSRGSGYYRPPQVFFQGSGGTGATATAATAAPGGGAAATSKINGSVIYCKVLNGGSGYRSSPQVTFTGGGNERISSLEAKLSAGEITQAEFDDSVSQFRATAQARIKGGVTLSVENGGEKYAHKMPSNSPPSPLAWESWVNRDYWRDGDMMLARFDLSNGYGSQFDGGMATSSTNERPGGAIVSMSAPEDPWQPSPPPIGYTGYSGWTQEPEVAFVNSRTVAATTRLRRCAIAMRSDVTPQAKSIYTWPHSMSHLESVLAMSDAETLESPDYGPQGLLGCLRRPLFGNWPAVAEFWSGGSVVSAYLDGVLSSPLPDYGTYIADGDRTAIIIQPQYSGMQYKFASPPTVQVECDAGTGASVTVSVDGSGTGTVNVASGGSGYGSLARTVVSGGRPKITPAAATATIVNGVVTAAAVTSQGEGYTSKPLVILHGGGGSGATAEAVMSSDGPFYSFRRRVVGVTITSSGSGYTSPPSVSFVETDKDYADYALPHFSWAWVYGHSEPSGWKARLVGVENATPEYAEMLGGDRDLWVNSGPSMPNPPSDLVFFYADGYVSSVVASGGGERSASHLKQLPSGATIVVRGNCDTTAAISVIRPKWSNELDGYGGVTFAVRDETP